MRVVFATGIFPPDIGGPATYVKSLASELLRRGIDVSVVTYGDRGADSRYPVRRVRRDRMLPRRYFDYLRSVYGEARAADVVYLQDPLSSGLPGWLGARLARTPILLKIVGDAAWEIARDSGAISDDFGVFQEKGYGPRVERIRRAQRLVARRVDRILVPSRFLEKVVTDWGVSERKIEVVPNSIPGPDGSRASREGAKQFLGLEGRMVVLSAGRLVPWKGFDSLIRLAAGMRKEFPGLRWLIAGGGPGEDGLRRLSREVGAEGAVTLLGSVPRELMAEYMTACDLFVLWSGYEGLSHVLLEAMRAGRAIVASDAGGNPELIETGKSGRLVPWRDDQALGRTLADLCRDPGERERLGREAAAASSRFAWPVMVERTLDLLRRVAAKDFAPRQGGGGVDSYT
jgi:glycosyltransferase involved in cell wall biosynthesis